MDDFDCDIINFYGNHSTIKATTGDRDEYTWITNTKTIFIASDIQIEGFNIAIENKGGTVILNNVVLKNNRMDYMIDPDWGAAIQNAGYCICNNCTFTNNYCSRGGAIFNTGRLELNNCTFIGNTGYTEGNDVLNVGDGIVILNGKKITEDEGPVTCTDSVTSTSDIIFYTTTALAAVICGAIFLCGGCLMIYTGAIMYFIGAIGIDLAILCGEEIFWWMYYHPRNQILHHEKPDVSPIDLTTPIKITDEINFK